MLTVLIDAFLFLATHILKYQLKPLLIQNVYGIRVAKKSVLYSPSPYTVSGGRASASVISL